MKKPQNQIDAERMLKALAEYPMMSTSEITQMLNISSQRCNNALRRLAGQLDITVISQKVRRFKLKPKVAVGVVVPTRAAPRESAFKSSEIYTGEKPTHRVSL